MAKKFSELEAKMSPESRERSDAKAKQMLDAMTKPSYEELRITKHSGSPQIADSASGISSSTTATEIRPVRIQRRRSRGWKMPANTIYVGRPTKWGNPFTERVWGLDLALRLFRDMASGIWNPDTLPAAFEDWRFTDANQNMDHWRSYFRQHPLDAIRAELSGKDLACWCPLNQPCHADVLLELANAAAEN